MKIQVYLYLLLFFISACSSSKNPGTSSSETKTVKAPPPEEKPVKVNLSAFKSYQIAKGSQRATMGLEFFTQNSMKFKVYFDESAKYQTQNKTNQADINKLYGFSDCFSPHQTNSARFGWRWYNDRLELLAYCYVDGKRSPETLISAIDLKKVYDCEIQVKEDRYIFKLKDVVKEMPRACSGEPAGYKLYPYFGGDESAPQDIQIWIQDL